MKERKQTMQEIPLSERPYEKCMSNGPEILTDAELLAIILRAGRRDRNCVELAYDVLEHAKLKRGLLGLHTLSMSDLMEIPGIGPVKAMQLKCLGEICKRMADTPKTEGIRFTAPDIIADTYMEHMRHLDQEHIVLLLLDAKCHLLKDITLSIGCVNHAVITPREVFITAFSYRAVNLILLHNHPSGDPRPSASDIAVTKRMKEVGELVGIPLMDHIILGDHRYTSMKEEGIL